MLYVDCQLNLHEPNNVIFIIHLLGWGIETQVK